MPYPLHQVPLGLARELHRRLGQVEAQPLSDPHAGPDDHPRLVRVVRALEILAHDEQTLYQLDRARVPQAQPEQVLRAGEVPLARGVSLLRRQRLDQLRREGEDDVEYANEDALVGVERRAREEGAVRVLEALPVEERVERVDVVPVEICEMVRLLAGREDVVGLAPGAGTV